MWLVLHHTPKDEICFITLLHLSHNKQVFLLPVWVKPSIYKELSCFKGHLVPLKITAQLVNVLIMLPVSESSQVGRTTLGGLLALGYTVVVSFKRTSMSVNRDQLLIVAEAIHTLNETFLVLKGPSRKVHILIFKVMSYCSFGF
jgi:hypothetical protein